MKNINIGDYVELCFLLDSKGKTSSKGGKLYGRINNIVFNSVSRKSEIQIDISSERSLPEHGEFFKIFSEYLKKHFKNSSYFFSKYAIKSDLNNIRFYLDEDLFQKLNFSIILKDDHMKTITTCMKTITTWQGGGDYLKSPCVGGPMFYVNGCMVGGSDRILHPTFGECLIREINYEKRIIILDFGKYTLSKFKEYELGAVFLEFNIKLGLCMLHEKMLYKFTCLNQDHVPSDSLTHKIQENSKIRVPGEFEGICKKIEGETLYFQITRPLSKKHLEDWVEDMPSLSILSKSVLHAKKVEII